MIIVGINFSSPGKEILTNIKTSEIKYVTGIRGCGGCSKGITWQQSCCL